MILRGVVETGVGGFAYWIDKLQLHYEQRTDMLVYPGTLNVRLNEVFDLPET